LSCGGVCRHLAIGAIQIFGEPAVILKPPQAGCGDEQILSTGGAGVFQVGDGGIVVGWMKPRPIALRRARQMQGRMLRKHDKIRIALADHGDCAPLGHMLLNQLPNAGDQLVVVLGTVAEGGNLALRFGLFRPSRSRGLACFGFAGLVLKRSLSLLPHGSFND
jgi:hypothetical protein